MTDPNNDGRQDFVDALRHSDLSKEEVIVIIEYLLLNLSMHYMSEDSWKVPALFRVYTQTIRDGFNKKLEKL